MTSQLSATGDPLRPVTSAEALALVRGLQRHTEQRPQDAEHPVVVLLTRFLLQGLNTRVDDTTTIPTRDLEDLQGRLDSALVELDIARAAVEVQDLRAQTAKAEAKAALADKFKDEVADAAMTLAQENEQLKADLADSKAAHDDTLAKLSKALSEFHVLAAKHAEAEERALQAQARGSQTEAQTAKAKSYLEDLRGRVKQAQQLLKSVEWAGKHHYHRDRNGAARCCPFCSGLHTSYQHSEVGHLRDCKFLTLELSLSKDGADFSHKPKKKSGRYKPR